MMKKGIILILLLSLTCSLTSLAQSRKGLRFNEVMTQNDSSLIDQYGDHNAWVEIFNSTYGTVGIEQMFISKKKIDIPADIDQKPKDFLGEYASAHPDICYEIPRGDKDTKVPPRTHVVFFADGNTAAGSLHLSFKLDPAKENTLYLYDVNGDLVDILVIPANLPANNSYALREDGKSELADGKFNPAGWAVFTGKTNDDAVTPGKFNRRVINENIEKFHKHDSHGWIITVTAMGIVFSALFMLFVLFFLFGLANKASEKKASQQAPAKLADISTDNEQKSDVNDQEAIAAICMALYQHLNAHDEESGILTFNRDTATAWSSKASLMRELPVKK